MRNSRLHSVLLPLVLALLIAGCASPTLEFASAPTPTPTVAMPELLPTPTPPLPGATAGLARILERRSLIVGWSQEARPPFIVVAEDGTIQGLDVLIADAFARAWLGRTNALAWRQNATIDDLVDGRVDLLMGGLVHTRAAETEIDFSQTYWVVEDMPIAVGMPENDSLLRTLVNATLQRLVDAGAWEEIVRTSTGAAPSFYPERWTGEMPSMANLAVSNRPATRSHLNPGVALTLAFVEAPGFATNQSNGSPAGFLPDLGRELNRRLTGTNTAQFVTLFSPAEVSRVSYDIYLGPQVHTWELERLMDTSITFYGDGLAMVARSGSPVLERTEASAREQSQGNASWLLQLDHRPVALVETPTSRLLFDAAVAAAGIEPIVFTVEHAEVAYALLAEGQVDAVLIKGYPAARMLAARLPDAVLAPGRHGPILPLVLTLPANDSALRDAVNLALQDMLADGTLAQLHSRYFGGDPPYPIELWPLR